GTGLGTRILTAMASSLKSDFAYDPGHNGTKATLVFSLHEGK
ncbi:two-component system sensor histidine kinase/response regulator, partial [Rhizobium ruizarguesonis]